MALAVLVIVGIIVLVVYLQSKRQTQIVRFSRADCKFCIDSQSEWDAFKAAALADKVDFNIVDVDIKNNSVHTRNWLAAYKIDSVPTILKISGSSYKEYDGPRTSAAYMSFALN